MFFNLLIHTQVFHYQLYRSNTRSSFGLAHNVGSPTEQLIGNCTQYSWLRPTHRRIYLRPLFATALRVLTDCFHKAKSALVAHRSSHHHHLLFASRHCRDPPWLIQFGFGLVQILQDGCIL
jgi:hypothetical protein